MSYIKGIKFYVNLMMSQEVAKQGLLSNPAEKLQRNSCRTKVGEPL